MFLYFLFCLFICVMSVDEIIHFKMETSLLHLQFLLISVHVYMQIPNPLLLEMLLFCLCNMQQ